MTRSLVNTNESTGPELRDNLRALALDSAEAEKWQALHDATPSKDLELYERGKSISRMMNHREETAYQAIKQIQELREFKLRDRDHLEVLVKARREIELEMVPMAKRREFESRLAYMIATKVRPIYKHHDAAINELPEKLSNCRTCGRIGVNPQGDKRFFWDHKCNQGKLCPDEARYEATRLAEVYIPEILQQCRQNKRIKIQKWVISPRNVPRGELHETKRRLFQVFSNLNRRKVGKNIVGSLVTQEDPFGIDEKSWNVHLNVLILVGGHLSWEDYRREFALAWGDGPDVQIDMKTEKDMWKLSEKKRQRRGDQMPLTREGVLMDNIQEMVKYACKITGSDHQKSTGDSPGHDSNLPIDRKEARPMDEWCPHAWFEWWMSNKGFRRTRSYGSLYRFEKVELPEAENCQVFSLIDLNRHQARFFYELTACPIDLIPADNSAISPPGFDYFDSYRGPPDG